MLRSTSKLDKSARIILYQNLSLGSGATALGSVIDFLVVIGPATQKVLSAPSAMECGTPVSFVRFAPLCRPESFFGIARPRLRSRGPSTMSSESRGIHFCSIEYPTKGSGHNDCSVGAWLLVPGVPQVRLSAASRFISALHIHPRQSSDPDR
jgi:hypothetical protein